MAKLTMDEVDDLLDRFHGFHDANYLGIQLVPPSAAGEKFSCVISLLAKDFRANRVVQAQFQMEGISEFRLCYNDNVDYPNVRDDIAIKEFEGKLFFDLGFSATQPQCADDIRASDIYFVGESISFAEEQGRGLHFFDCRIMIFCRQHRQTTCSLCSPGLYKDQSFHTCLVFKDSSMAAQSRIVAADGTTVAEVTTHDYRYYLIDNQTLRMIDEIEAYCWDCREFVASEWIRTPEEVSAQLNWVKSQTGQERDKAEFIFGTVQQITEKFQSEQDFFRDRRSGPRCLSCRSTNIVQARHGLGISPTRLFHPDYDPIGLTVEGFAFASTSSFYRLFNVEGEELEMPIEELVDTVNRCHGKRMCGIQKNGKIFYGQSFEDA